MPFDDIRAALVALFSQPIAVASVVFLAGINAGIWLLVFQRAGFPPVLASLLLVPPLTLLLPLYFALARWPSQRLVRVSTPPAGARSWHRKRRRPVLGAFDNRRPLRLDANGLPQFRIQLPPSTAPSDLPARDYLRELESRYPRP